MPFFKFLFRANMNDIEHTAAALFLRHANVKFAPEPLELEASIDASYPRRFQIIPMESRFVDDVDIKRARLRNEVLGLRKQCYQAILKTMGALWDGVLDASPHIQKQVAQRAAVTFETRFVDPMHDCGADHMLTALGEEALVLAETLQEVASGQAMTFPENMKFYTEEHRLKPFSDSMLDGLDEPEKEELEQSMGMYQVYGPPELVAKAQELIALEYEIAFDASD
jgi:hypothetical protein